MLIILSISLCKKLKEVIMKRLINLLFMVVALLLLPACSGEPDFIKNAPSASGNGSENTEDDENTDNEEPAGEVVDPNFQIYLCFGQSNMEGFAQWNTGYNGIEEVDKTVDERFKTLCAVSDNAWSRELGKWYDAVPPLCRPGTGLCPADYFGRTMVAELSKENPDIKIGVIVVAMGGAGIKAFHKTEYVSYYQAADDWQRSLMDAYGRYPYGRLVDMARMAQKQGVIKGILMHQGETDGCGPEWRGYVADIYNNLISDLSLTANETPLLVGELLDDNGNGLGVGRNSDLLKISELVPNSYVVSSDGCTVAEVDVNDQGENNYLHFSSEGYRELGRHYAETMISVLSNQKPVEPGDVSVPVTDDCFDFAKLNSDLEGLGRGSWNPETGLLTTSQWGIGGWKFDTPVDFTAHKYLVVEFKEAPTIYCQIAFYSDGRSVYDRSYCVGASKRVVIDTSGTYTTTSPSVEGDATLDMTSIKMFGIQTGGDETGVQIDRIYVTDENPDESENPGTSSNPVSNDCFDFSTLNSDLEGQNRGSWDASTGHLVTSSYGIGGWIYDTPVDFTAYRYLVVEFKEQPSFYTVLAFYSDGKSVYDYSYAHGVSGKTVVFDTSGIYETSKYGVDEKKKLDLTNIQMFGIQTGGDATGVNIERIYVTNDDPLAQ